MFDSSAPWVFNGPAQTQNGAASGEFLPLARRSERPAANEESTECELLSSTASR
jgi:hypothetical protein